MFVRSAAEVAVRRACAPVMSSAARASSAGEALRARVERLEPRVLMSLSVPAFSSDPQATRKLFLDFDGLATAPVDWSPAAVAPAFDQDGNADRFNDNELAAIGEIWARVADRYAPFNVDVTTVDPGNRADGVTMAVVIGGDGRWYDGGQNSGVAQEGGFRSPWASNTAFVFSAQAPFNVNLPGNVAAHEAGHGFGLDHQSDRDFPPGERPHDYGTGGTDPVTGDTLVPVMGSSNSGSTGWWYGPTPDYLGGGAETYQDDVAVLSNTLGSRADDAGNARPTSTNIGALDGAVDVRGLIGTVGDVDWRSFTTAGGLATLYVNFEVAVPSMLSPSAELRDAAGNVVAVAERVAQYWRVRAMLAAGTYHLVVKGDGWVPVVGSNADFRNDYADVGAYHVTGGIELADPDDTIGESSGRADRMKNVGETVDLEMGNPVDVDLIGFTVSAGQRVAFDLDSRGGSVLDTYLRLFDSGGVEIAANDDGADVGEAAGGFSFVDRTFANAGTYYVGVSLAPNRTYDANVGDGDTDGAPVTGIYRLNIVDRSMPAAGPIPARVAAAGGPITLSDGRVFASASGFAGGAERATPFEVAGTEDDRLYSTMRYGTEFTFARNVPNGSYTVYLYMTEPTLTEPGGRAFDVSAEGNRVLADYDVFARAGLRSAHRVAVPVGVIDGQLNLRFLSKVGNAIVSAIAIAPRHEAESATRGGVGGGPIVAAQNGGYTGGGYADFTADAGQSIQFTVHAATTGPYQLAIRYANGRTADRPLALAVNGVTKTTALTFGPTGSWTTWREVVYDVTLSAGTNTIRLTATGRSGANIDSLALA